MVPKEPTFLFEKSGSSTGGLTHVSEVLKDSGIPVPDSLKAEMYDELVQLTEEEYTEILLANATDDQLRSA